MIGVRGRHVDDLEVFGHEVVNEVKSRLLLGHVSVNLARDRA